MTSVDSIKIMEKRTILAIGLSVLVLIGFQWYQQHYMKPMTPAGEKQSTAASVQKGEPQEQAPKCTTGAAGGSGATAVSVVNLGGRHQCRRPDCGCTGGPLSCCDR